MSIIKRKRFLRITALIILLACIAVAAWIGWSHFRSNSQVTKIPPSKLTQAQKEAPHTKIFGDKTVVLINESIFGPETLIIKAGSTVEWTNMETTSHQVVTDDGTTITAANSPALAQGKSFDFVFAKAGTYKYHDNLHPKMQGTITVQ